MKFIELCITTTTAGSEMLSGVLMGAGVDCFIISDPSDLDLIMENKEIPVDYVEDSLLEADHSIVTVKSYLAINEQGLMQRDRIVEGVMGLKNEFGNVFDLGSLDIAMSEVDDSDWADNWKAFFHPMDIGKRFKVKPTWEECENDGRIIIEIDPESSFGSGQHETTALCLEMLESCVTGGENILDMGCGSGILGIGCAKLGAQKILGVDIDRNASDIANKNAVVNGVQNAMTAICGNVLTSKETYDTVMAASPYDIIAANIVADVLKAMADMFMLSLKSGGILICSGIIGPRADEVEQALKDTGFIIDEIMLKNDWAAIKCHKQ